MWLRGLVSLALIAGGITGLVLWYNHRGMPVVERRAADGSWMLVDQLPADAPDGEDRRKRWVSWQFGANRETAYLLGGIALLLWSVGGGPVVYPRLLSRGGERPQPIRGESLTVHRPDGTEIHVDLFGPPTGIPIVLTHGWSLDSREWYYAKTGLARQYRVIVWDLPGVRQSAKPADRNFSLEQMAHDLDAVVSAVNCQPVVLLGHSIGGMIGLTYCRLFPEKMGKRVRGLVVAQSTYTNPVKTTRFAGLMQALQKPLLEPLAHLMVWLAPVARLLNWMSYANGSLHRSTERSSFSGQESWGHLDFLTRLSVAADPAVVGRGFLAMFRYDATTVLPTISVPVLVLTANGDRSCLPEASTYMARTIPFAEQVTLGEGRHCAVFEFHQEFHSAVSEFVTRIANDETNGQAGGAAEWGEPVKEIDLRATADTEQPAIGTTSRHKRASE